MPFTTWIRDLFGIRKDVIDIKKAKLEITKLEDEEDERRGLIELATLEDVKKYDPKVRYLGYLIESGHQPLVNRARTLRRRALTGMVIGVLLCLAVIVILKVSA